MNEKWFIRSPQKYVDETYMRNMIDATQFFLRGWLDFECFMYDHKRVTEIFIKKLQKKLDKPIGLKYYRITNVN